MKGAGRDVLPRPPVVVGLDQDQPGVVHFALQEAERLGTSVRFVHCHDGTARPRAVSVLDRARDQVRASRSSVEVAYDLHQGQVGAGLVDAAADAATVIVGAHDVTWLHNMVGGAMTGRLVAGVSCPVVVVPVTRAGERSAGGVAVTLDGDTSPTAPLRYGFEQADYRVQGLHVLQATPAGTSESDTEMLGARTRAEVALWTAGAPHVPIQLSLTNDDVLAECVLAAAAASLLVIGRPHGQNTLFALARPVAMMVLREARCPVAIVPAHYRAR